MKQFLSHVLLIAAILCCSQTLAQDSTPQFDAQQLEFFESKVRPILVERCFECHGPESTPLEGGLSLGSRKAMITGGDTGAAINPGNAKSSLIIEAINYSDVYEMPPDTKMPDDEIGILTQWVNMGAPWPSESDVAVEEKAGFDLEARRADHWCWQPIKKQKTPAIKNENWPKDPIDLFVLDKVETAGLSPGAPAAKTVLIRRAYFDLAGLPPTREQVQAFVADESDNAFEKVIDGLLASPSFGERWARHWMDLARYAESGGHEFDYNIHHAFRYRDYLIRSFNEDVSYKQFIIEQIAGDLLENPRRHPTEDYNESIIGTGFWFLGEGKHGAVDSREEEARTIDNQIDVMSKSFLGLTVACARCHDHKFDAISAEDYYALAGFLQSSRHQEAMLDPGRKIETQFNKASQLVNQGNKVAGDFVQQLQNQDTERLAKYLDAAIEVLHSNPALMNSGKNTIEAESLKQIALTAGEGLVQTIKARGNFGWSGDKQYWWKHGKPGDSLELEFQLPKNFSPGVCEIKTVFTIAPDYGAATIAINGEVVKEAHDFYATELATTGEMSLGKVKLVEGKNILKLTLTERNENATPSDMIGIDYLVLTPPVLEDDEKRDWMKAVADTRKLDAKLLGNLVSALLQPAVRHGQHPLNLAFVAAKSSTKIDKGFSNVLKSQSNNEQSLHNKSIESSELFADFSNGLPADWFRTGYAFGVEDTEGNSPVSFSASGNLIGHPGTVSSGQFGPKFFGVIRSPTFELKHGQINWRVKGTGATVRLIINGYRMDEHSALLYKGCKQELKPSEQFAWQVQRGDIPNHIGHRAHLEIIDHRDGHIVVDEIRFSNSGKSLDPPSAVKKQVAGSFNSRKTFCESLAKAIVKQLKNRRAPQFAQSANWILENDLSAMFTRDKNKRVSKIHPPTSYVSLLTVDNSWGNSNGKTTRESVKELNSVLDALKRLNANVPSPVLASAMTEGTGEEEHIFIRGNHKTPGKVATRRFLSAISGRPLNPSDGSGRLLLAKKITAPNNPLTSRVAVNRLWHHLFGRGIVESVDDFGKLGSKPSHPELLDYLAAEFMKDNWSVKRMLKRLMMTRTYQMASTTNPEAKTIDPDNLLLHRSNIRRLQGEVIRDSMLSISGRLDSKMFGPPVPVHLTKFMQGRGRPGQSGRIDGEGRRSIYISVRRNFLSPMMLAFDTPIPFNAIGKRNQSNVPAQSLILLNDPFVIGEAKRWAETLVAREEKIEARVKMIYWQAIGRAPTKAEIEQAKKFIEIQANELKVEPDHIMSNVEVWKDFCHVVFNLKEFIFIN